MSYAGIIGTGSYLPERIVENAELEEHLGLEPGWIEDKTGVRQRRRAADDQAPSHLAAAAAQAALDNAGIDASALDGIITATTVPDTFCPSTACRVQAALGATNAWAFDVNAASGGFLAALAAGNAMVSCGDADTVCVIGAETTSRFMNWDDYKTCILFGDGAGAVVLRRDAGHKILATHLGADGSGADALVVPGGGAAMPPSHEVVDQHLATLHMKGGDVFRFAMRIIGEAAETVLTKCNLCFADVSLIVPHQSNRRIIQEASKITGVPFENFYLNLDRVGNTSVASVPVALAEACANGRLNEADLLVMVSYGAGLSWGATAVRW